MNKSRRDFLMLTSGAMGVVGTGAFLLPLARSLNPSADVLALSTLEVDLKPIQEGQAITVMWRDKPVFIRHRTQAEIEEVRRVALHDLKDPEKDEDRFRSRPEWLIVVGICTHLGCVPSGQKPCDAKGSFNGWICPCHGTEYDASGRVRCGPAPRNLDVPPYKFITETTVLIGAQEEA